MSGIGLRTRDGRMASGSAEYRFHSLRLVVVVERRRRAVRIDVADSLRFLTCIGERTGNDVLSPLSVGRRRREIVRVGEIAIAGHLGEDARTASSGRLELFEAHDSGSLGEH